MNTDRDLLVQASSDIKWIKDSMERRDREYRELKKDVDAIKRKVYFIFGGLGAIEMLAHFKEAMHL